MLNKEYKIENNSINPGKDFKENFIPLLRKQFKDKIYGFVHAGMFIDIGTPSNLKKAETILQ